MDQTVLLVLLVVCGLSLLFSVITLCLQLASKRALRTENDRLRRSLAQENANNLQSVSITLKNSQSLQIENQKIQMDTLRQSVSDQLGRMENQVKYMAEQNERKLEAIRTGNEKKLEEMRQTVDEKLQKTLEERISRSFESVNRNLEAVYKGLGDMQKLAGDVGGLKQVLSNVKTRGTLGEIQLGAILSEILAPEQYDCNVQTIPGRSTRVEFAVKMPGDGRDFVYLPIDSKFPLDAYQHLLDAYDTSDTNRVEDAWKLLEQRIKGCAKDIRDKYVLPPYTTDFAILFLPTEGLYAEVVRRGMVEILQQQYRVNIAGPTTMAALLNSLQMGFRTLAIQKRSGEVWQLLGGVKGEFEKFGSVLQKHQERLTQAGDELEKLIGTRTNAINRKLREVESLSPAPDKPSLDEGAKTDLFDF